MKMFFSRFAEHVLGVNVALAQLCRETKLASQRLSNPSTHDAPLGALGRKHLRSPVPDLLPILLLLMLLMMLLLMLVMLTLL